MIAFKIFEKLDPRKHDVGDYIDDFMKSDAPQFKGKSKEKIRKMAIAAYLDAKETVKEDEKRTPRKKGQHTGSSSHSDLYTDEDPKGTIHGLGFKDAATANKSVEIITKSDRTHAHKVQATLVMQQRSKVAIRRTKDPEKKKNIEAANKIFTSHLEKLKKITKQKNEYLEMGTKQISYKYRKDTPGQQTNMKREKFIPKNIVDEDVPAFMGALSQAAKEGKKQFKFEDKKYRVRLKEDTVERHFEATESDYMKLSDKELDELIEIFKDVSRKPSNDVIGQLKREKMRRFIKESHLSTNNKKEEKKMYFNDKRTQNVAEAVKRVMNKEGNAFGKAVVDAKKAGKKKFKFNGKDYNVEEIEEQLSDAQKKILQGVIDGLKGAVKAHGGQYKELEKLMDEIDFQPIQKKLNTVKEGDRKEGYHEEMPKTKADILNAVYSQLKAMKKDDLMASYNMIKASHCESVEEETELQEGKFDKLEKKLGRINPETLGAVMKGKIKLNPAEKKEFDEFMKGVQKMFASKQY
tara:strand:+ start:230 stop:1792 length:1563 start_codon:yes stop_codon:yes gene_type:complete